MGIDKGIKKKVIEDWQNALPQLTIYAQNKLYKVIGPCVLGIELIKSPYTESYSPYFVIYPIWKEDIKASLEFPIFLREFKNFKGLQQDIPYEKHHLLFDAVLDSVKTQTPLPFEGNVSFKKLSTAIEEASQKPPLNAAPNSYLQAILQEAKFKIALFCSAAEAQRELDQINQRSWDPIHFKAFKVNINDWLQGLSSAINNREDFLRQIEANKQDKKISQLKSSEIVS